MSPLKIPAICMFKVTVLKVVDSSFTSCSSEVSSAGFTQGEEAVEAEVGQQGLVHSLVRNLQ